MPAANPEAGKMSAEIDWTAPLAAVKYPPGTTINPFYGYSFSVAQDGQITVVVTTGGTGLNLVSFNEAANGLTIASPGNGTITMTGLASQVVDAIVSGAISYTTPSNALQNGSFSDATGWSQTGFVQTPALLGNGSASFTDPAIGTTPDFFQFGQLVDLAAGQWQLSFNYTVTQGASDGYYGLSYLDAGWYSDGVGTGSDSNPALPNFSVGTWTSGTAVLDFSLASELRDYLVFQGGNANMAISDVVLVQVAPIAVTITSAGSFSQTGGNSPSSQTIATQNVNCFAAGTMLLTPSGEVAVEALRPGDLVITVAGRGAAPKPIRWIGRSRIDLDRHPDPGRAAPIRVQAHAFAAGAPHRDLLLSPEHAVLVRCQGVAWLVPIHRLVNGASIRREPASGVVRYFHVELDRHDAVLAGGLACETYLDTGNRMAFDNAAGPRALHPDFAADLRAPDPAALAVWAAQGCAALLREGAELDALRDRLSERAAALGYALSDDPALHCEVDGVTVASRAGPAGTRTLLLPAGAQRLVLRSASSVPADLCATASDRRCLGVALAGLVLDGRPLRLEPGLLAAGFHPPERQGGTAWVWTDGAGMIALPASRQAMRLEIVLLDFGARYWTAAPPPRMQRLRAAV
jgi:hypothetical protein